MSRAIHRPTRAAHEEESDRRRRWGMHFGGRGEGKRGRGKGGESCLLSRAWIEISRRKQDSQPAMTTTG